MLAPNSGESVSQSLGLELIEYNIMSMQSVLEIS